MKPKLTEGTKKIIAKLEAKGQRPSLLMNPMNPKIEEEKAENIEEFRTVSIPINANIQKSEH